MPSHQLLALRAGAAHDPGDFIDSDRQTGVLEKGDHLGGGLKITIRLGFKPQVNLLAGVVANGGQIGDDSGQVGGHGEFVFIPGDPRLEGAGDRADGAIDFRRKEMGEDLGKLDGVIAPRRGAPVGIINGFLDRARVELPVWKTVDGERVKLVLGEKVAGLMEQGLIAGELCGCLVGEPQSDAKPLIRGNELFDGKRFGGNRGKVLRPRLAWMDIQTVGQVERRFMLENH